MKKISFSSLIIGLLIGIIVSVSITFTLSNHKNVENDINLSATTAQIADKSTKELLKKWKEQYKQYETSLERNGYLEIKNTRVIEIKKDTTIDDFRDIDYVVEYILYSDYFGTQPYYSNANLFDTVIIYKDGTTEVRNNIFNIYRAKNYENDFSNIINSITDCGNKYNNTYHL